MRSDEEIKKNIEAALKWDARVDADEIDVDVKNRIVYLDGCVNTYTEKAAAVELAMNAAEVANVEDDISVVPFSVETDATLIADVESALLRDVRVDAEDIVIGVRNGIVTLSGKAATIDEKASAEEDTRSVFGVSDVINRIEVAPPVIMSDIEITQAVMEDLGESENLPRNLDISVHTENGKVYVTGRVPNIQVRRAVENIVWHTPGVRSYVMDVEVE
ncbi:MAG: BON domain-containing protein [bacterium]|jgi:osmotically-inducible protein OsmY|nr:BON domain-containing protein [bacterium]